ncbi:transporter substrate-binding domain-containing protein [Halospina sp. K52047b]|uniref:substrate-binding periplasmic protein n=1 Tax=Halospina sp. K52047b TaxID=2614160 RepID=UPI00124A0D6A|nr:transporter substrate-binding domain-containing protein [Halospina sp. K52047b]KAA8977784.1 transporter substrate-binding domain-containing protein [Halospina sp. K52047b]
MRPIALFAVAFLLLVAPAWSETDGEDLPVITLVADEWCPFNCAPDAESPGILVEIARQALLLEGYRVDYQSMPWRRAIRGVRNGNFHGIIGAGPAETPDFHFPDQPLAMAHHSLFTLPDNDWTYTSLESLAAIRLGVIQEYSYGGLHDDYIQPNESNNRRLMVLSGNQVLPRLIQLLEMGRIDALAAEEKVLEYHYSQEGRINPLRNAGLAYQEELYIAFSPAKPDGRELADALNRGMTKLREQGMITDILNDYSALKD